MNKKEIKINTQTVYEGPIFTVKQHNIITSNNKRGLRDVVYHNGGAAVIAITDDDDIILVKQYRIAIDKTILEIPAGKLEKDENPLICVNRELREETGYASNNITSLGIIYPTPGYSSEIIHLYLARNLYYSPLEPDDDEVIEVIKIKTEQLMALINDGTISDSKTIIAIYRYLMS